MSYVKNEDILAATNGGLDIILSYYPQAEHAINRSDKRFKIREERTPSAAIKQLKDGNYVVTDFGDDSIPRNAISVCQLEENLSYREAIAVLADRYQVGGIKNTINKPTFYKRPATSEEEEGHYYYIVNEKISEKELEVLGPLVTEKVCKDYHVNSLKSYTYIKNREALVTESTETFPIFLFNDSNKIYSPLNPQKGYRFRYVGEKEKDFVNGLKQLEEAYKKFTRQQDNEEKEEQSYDKLPEAILCSGERDALNIAGHGFFPVWLNSETAKLTPLAYKKITYCVDTLYNLPDIDSTGIKAAVNLGLKYLDIKTILLPMSLRTYRDNRGKPRKDLLDYVSLYPKKYDFKKLLDVAKPMRFWDTKYNKDGSVKYNMNPAHALFFLWGNGFGRIDDKNSKEGSKLIRINGNVVQEIFVKDIRSFFLEFIEAKYLNINIENMVLKSNDLNEDRMVGMKKREIDFTDFSKDSQALFFDNCSILVNKDEIKQYKPGELDSYTWEEKVINHNFKKKAPFFKISKGDNDGMFEIDVLDNSSHYFNYLINASRIYWQKELEVKLESLSTEEAEAYKIKNKFNIKGSLLSPEEQAEQMQHLVNKIFSIGYLLHNYKNKARPWAIYAVDNKLAGLDESCGGSGKSFCYSSLNIFKKFVTLPGRDDKLTNNPHIYDRVSEYTDMVLIDDCERNLKFNFFFDVLTGVMSVNPKNNQSYEIPFDKSPKFCFTSNYMLKNPDPSTLRRILFTVFSDYYHEKTENSSYRETRKIADDFGKQLFDEYNEEEWNNDLNFFAQCLQFYLSVPSPKKINPPMQNVILRNLLAEMGETFKDWAEVYFSPTGEAVDTLVKRDEALSDFIQKTNSLRWTTNKFTKALKAFCAYYDYTYNPNDLLNSQGRIMRKIDNKTTDMIYIQTKEELNPTAITAESSSNMPKAF